MAHGHEHIFDEKFCTEFCVFPEEPHGNTVTVHVCDQSDLSILDYVRFVTRCRIDVRWVPRETLQNMIAAKSYTAPSRSRSSHLVPLRDNGQDEAAARAVVQRIDGIIGDAIEDAASDIHFEPGEKGLRCRVRLDGLLLEKERIERHEVPEIISRLKIMAGLDIAEKRRPQDGRIRFQHGDRLVDIRVSLIPTDFGEKAVLRLLDKRQLRLNLEALGFMPDQLQRFKEAIGLPHGIILVTGPTGSGKTTTLYAALNSLRSPTVNISTVEDPIEYNLEGINQTQVKPEINLTFAAMLRALLRQDPNIIMVGEVRDRETLDIALRASLTGHLVLSTLHANSAVATIARLLDMGAQPFLLATCLKLVVAQRLIRKNCRSCLTGGLDEENRAAAGKSGITLLTRARQSAGCQVCHGTGFMGRTAIYELLSLTGPVREAILNRQSEQAILSCAREDGFGTMVEVARALVESGVTTPLEVLSETDA